MARQNTSPVAFGRSRRTDTAAIMTSGRAGKVVPIGYLPVLRGDSASGSVGIDIDLAEMPRPLLNGVQANIQAWFVPKSIHPQFSGYEEFLHSYQELPIKGLSGDREAPRFFNFAKNSLAKVQGSEFAKTLGLHFPSGGEINTDLIDAYNLVYNFRLASYSSRLERSKYFAEDQDDSLKLKRAFWPAFRNQRVVPDYERALIVGALDLDVTAGRIPVKGIERFGAGNTDNLGIWREGSGASAKTRIGNGARDQLMSFDINATTNNIFAEMEGTSVGVTLADIDKARTTQAFAKLRTAYAGNDTTGFDNDEALVAELMQGFNVPQDYFKRPWLLDSKRVAFGFEERHATDGPNLESSVTQGRVSARLSLNLPVQDTGGVIIYTLEVMPERLDERQSDPWVETTYPSGLPDALRDVQRPEPVDAVLNSRLDAKHSQPNGLYGYEPMNDRWNRDFTRLGGSFFQDTPGAEWTEQRSALWLADIVDPKYSEDHFLAPEDFPHSVFSDTEAPAFEVVARHAVTLVGLTQIGDVLAENNDDYEAVEKQ